MKTTRFFLLLLMLLATSGLNAQKEEDKYAALVSEVRNEVWSLNLPDFKNMTVPEKYRNEPAVILAAHSRLEVTRKTKLDWWGMGLTKQQITPAMNNSVYWVCASSNRTEQFRKQPRRSTWKPMKAATHVATTSKRNGTSWPYPDWKSETSSTCSSYDTPY